MDYVYSSLFCQVPVSHKRSILLNKRMVLSILQASVHLPDNDRTIKRGRGQVADVGGPGQIGDNIGVAALADGEIGHLSAVFEPGAGILQIPEIDQIGA